MKILGFFSKNKGNEEKIVRGFFSKLNSNIKNWFRGTDQQLSLIFTHINKLESKQKELSIQLEDIYDSLQSDDKEKPLVEALIAMLDIIESFYRYAGVGSSLYTQAQMMWKNALSSAEDIGLSCIDDTNIPIDFARHEATQTEHIPDMPPGLITKTLQCGYIYNNIILRRSKVIITVKGSENNESWN